MTSETDAAFLDRLEATTRQPCHETCEPSRGQHHINCPNIAKAYADRIEQLEAALLGEETEHSRRIMEVERLRAALREIGKPPDHFTINDAMAVARAALEERT